MLRTLTNDQRWDYFHDLYRRGLLKYRAFMCMVRVASVLQRALSRALYRYQIADAIIRQFGITYSRGSLEKALADMKRQNIVSYIRLTSDLRFHKISLN